MPQYIIHKDGAFNLYTTIADGAIFESALTRAQLERWYKQEYGRKGMEELPARIERALRRGTSALTGETLDDLIACNRAGPKETKLSPEEFVRRYLTLEG